MNRYFNHEFQKILILPINNFEYNHVNYNFNNLIPIEWQLILMSDGSFTQNLNSLTGKCIQVEIFSNSKYKISNHNNDIREVWLKDYKFNNLAFAKSLWPIYINKIELPKKKPIGQSLIEFQVDIYKEIHEIYYGYSAYLEYKFNINGPIWGRKYTIYFKGKPLATIQEFFSPEVINFFKQQK